MGEQIHHPKHNATSFQKGRAKTGGRVLNQLPKMPALLKECLLKSAELEGSDGEGKDGVIGMCRRIAKEDIRAYASLLGRVMPLQVEMKNDPRLDVVYESIEEVNHELEERGINLELIQELMKNEPLEVEYFEEDTTEPECTPPSSEDK